MIASRAPFALRASVAAVALGCAGLGFAAGWMASRPAAAPPSFLAQLTRDLSLRPDQVAAVDALLAGEDEAIDAIVREHARLMQEPIAERREQTQQALLAILDEAQRRRFDERSREPQR